MKSKKNQRLLALILSMVLMLSASISAMAEGEMQTEASGTEVTENQAAAQSLEEEKAPETEVPTEETETDTQSAEISGEPVQESTEQGTAEIPVEDSGASEELAESVQEIQEKTADMTEEQSESTKQQEEVSDAGETLVEENVFEGVEQFPSFDSEYSVEDGSAVIHAKADEGVLPEGTVFYAERITEESENYDFVAESLDTEAAKDGNVVLDFIAYDITFHDSTGNEIEPNGDVEISIEFKSIELEENNEGNAKLNVVHVDDNTNTEKVEGNIESNGTDLYSVDFVTNQFSIYAISKDVLEERLDTTIKADDYAIIEFWDKDNEGGNANIEFTNKNISSNDARNIQIQVYIEDKSVYTSERFRLDLSEEEYELVNLQTTVKPGSEYYLNRCEWKKAGSSDVDTFGGSGSTGLNKGDNILKIYLFTANDNLCTEKITNTRSISVDLYNYDTEAYNNAVGLNSESLLLRNAWGNYKADGYKLADSGDNSHNESCGKTGIFYGLVSPSLVNNNIQFYKNAKFFDNSFSSSVGEKYADVDFEFLYDDETKEYSYSSEINHVHFNENLNTVSQYQGKGPNTLPDGSDTTKYGFFPFTDENDNLTDYGFGMRMDVEFELLSDGTIDGNTPMTFSFSGDDDVWVFIDGKLALDLGGLHSRRGGTINFKDKSVIYDQVTYKENGSTVTESVTSVGGGSQPDVSFLEDLEAGTHTLTMYYLERGGNDSNCEIKFNLLVVDREGTLEFEKIDSETEEGLSGVSFSLYDTEEITDDTEPVATAISDSDGKVIFDISELDVSKPYFLKEDSVPFGYQEDNTLYSVSLSQNKEGTTIKITGEIKKDNIVIESIENTPKENTGGTTSVSIEKKWMEGIQEIPIEMTLYADGMKVENPNIANPVTLEKEPWTYTWNNLPGDVEYTVQEKVPDGYTASVKTEYQFDINTPYEEIKPCNWLERELGSNGVVAIKKGSDFFVWTTIELNSEEKKQLLAEIRTITNGFSDSSTTFRFGSGTFNELDGSFTFKYNNGVLQMSIDASNAWSWLLLGTYTKTVKTTITNSVDTTKTIEIPIKKEWKGNPEQYEQYDSVTIQLLKNGEPYENPIKILKSDNWEYTYENLPYYSLESTGKVVVNQYTIEETKVGDSIDVDLSSDWLKVEITGNAEEGFVITNSIPERWIIQKVSSTNKNLPLEGAEFILRKNGDEQPSYYGKSLGGTESKGYVAWWEKENDIDNFEKVVSYIDDGEYILEETKAPNGYQKNKTTWTILIEDLQIKSIKDNKGNNIIPKPPTSRAEYTASIYLYENTPLYTLPSAGGSGIFLHMIGGTLLLMAGSLMIYINRCKGVLRK